MLPISYPTFCFCRLCVSSYENNDYRFNFSRWLILTDDWFDDVRGISRIQTKMMGSTSIFLVMMDIKAKYPWWSHMCSQTSVTGKQNLELLARCEDLKEKNSSCVSLNRVVRCRLPFIPYRKFDAYIWVMMMGKWPRSRALSLVIDFFLLVGIILATGTEGVPTSTEGLKVAQCNGKWMPNLRIG